MRNYAFTSDYVFDIIGVDPSEKKSTMGWGSTLAWKFVYT